MKTSDNGRALIEAFEGLYLRPYQDSVGVWTIGYGHTTAAGGPAVNRSAPAITSAHADQLLADDLARVEQNVARCITVPLAQYEFDALVSFDFNTGKLASSTVRTKINAGNKAGAMQTLLLYDHAGGVELSGLTRRRIAERLLFEGKVKPALDLAGGHVPPPGLPMPKASLPPPPQAPIPPPPDVEPVPQPPPPTSVIALIIQFIISMFKKGN